MKELKQAIADTILQNTDINWFIIHQLADRAGVLRNVSFSYMNKKERRSEPFEKQMGYICFEKGTSVARFKKMLQELIGQWQSEPIALANLYTLLGRASFNGDEKAELLENFKLELKKHSLQAVYDLLINSLNKHFYKHAPFAQSTPATTQEYLDKLHNAQYYYTTANPLMATLRLVREDRGKVVQYQHIQKFNSTLRAILFGLYRFDLSIPKNTFDKLLKNESELQFLSALLLSYTIFIYWLRYRGSCIGG